MLRSVILSFSLIPMAGCATVSMVSGQAIVETGLVDEKTSLEKVCDAYEAKAKSQAWIEPSPGFFGLARTLVDGGADISAPGTAYLNRLESRTSSSDEMLTQLVADIESAATGLKIVNVEAEASLEQSGDIESDDSRERVMSYEGALVTAQKSRRSFIAALEVILEDAPDLDPDEADEALFALNSAIDDARSIADRLAGAYSALSELQVNTSG